MDDQLYREYILEHYKHPHNHGSLEHPDMEAHDLNPLCGDELTFQVTLGEDGKVSQSPSTATAARSHRRPRRCSRMRSRA